MTELTSPYGGTLCEVLLGSGSEAARSLRCGHEVARRGPDGVLLALLHVQDVWEPDPAREARAVFGTEDEAHSGVAGGRKTARA